MNRALMKFNKAYYDICFYENHRVWILCIFFTDDVGGSDFFELWAKDHLQDATGGNIGVLSKVNGKILLYLFIDEEEYENDPEQCSLTISVDNFISILQDWRKLIAIGTPYIIVTEDDDKKLYVTGSYEIPEFINEFDAKQKNNKLSCLLKLRSEYALSFRIIDDGDWHWLHSENLLYDSVKIINEYKIRIYDRKIMFGDTYTAEAEINGYRHYKTFYPIKMAVSDIGRIEHTCAKKIDLKNTSIRIYGNIVEEFKLKSGICVRIIIDQYYELISYPIEKIVIKRK